MWAKCTSPTPSWSIYCKWACLCWFPDQLLYSELRSCIYLSIGYFKWTALNAEVLLSGLVLQAYPGTCWQHLADGHGCWRQPSGQLYPASSEATRFVLTRAQWLARHGHSTFCFSERTGEHWTFFNLVQHIIKQEKNTSVSVFFESLLWSEWWLWVKVFYLKGKKCIY